MNDTGRSWPIACEVSSVSMLSVATHQCSPSVNNKTGVINIKLTLGNQLEFFVLHDFVQAPPFISL